MHEPELDYEVESDEDWEEPDDAEVLTVRSVMLVWTAGLMHYATIHVTPHL